MEYGLIGEKLGHSFSKPIHERLGDYEYEIREIPPEALDSFMKAKNFKGINVTIPYKQAVIPYLDYVDEKARLIGAVNTVVNKDGRLFGYNTDFDGLAMLIEKSGFELKGKNVLILGTGATSKTASAVAEYMGAGEVSFVSRNGDINYENLYDKKSDTEFIINTTPVGMYPHNDGLAVDVGRFEKLKGVWDVVYNPLRTRLYIECEKRGIACSCGLYMLVCQAIVAAEHFTQKSFEKEKIAEEIFFQLQKDTQNIVLVGMPGSGKTTVGNLLAQSLGRKFVDTDSMITKKYSSISDLITSKGEEFFREIEAEAVKEAALSRGCVIATGGGAVLREENIRRLKQTSKIIFLDRPVEKILPTEDRPLSRDKEALQKRYEERYPIYLSVCDERIINDKTAQEATKRILSLLK